MKIRLVGDHAPGIYEYADAVKIANSVNLELVKISDGGESYPVYKIFDSEKAEYEKKKKNKALKLAQKGNVIKEIRLTPNISENDLNTKINYAKNFFNKGFKIKVVVTFSGRSINFKSIGEETLLKFIVALEDFYKPERMPTMEGKKLFTYLLPKK